jgi:hypothetical protein
MQYICNLDFYIYSNFGGIFAELLPGNFAKLQPPDGQVALKNVSVACTGYCFLISAVSVPPMLELFKG